MTEKRFFDFDEKLWELAETVEASLTERFAQIDRITEYNQQKVLSAFIRHGVSETHFAATTGYGYGDRGRDMLDEVFADIFETEDALVRHSILSGTHAITIALFGVLQPGDIMLAATGRPYDTLHQVIGIAEKSPGSLAEMGVGYQEVALNDRQKPDLPDRSKYGCVYNLAAVHLAPGMGNCGCSGVRRRYVLGRRAFERYPDLGIPR